MARGPVAVWQAQNASVASQMVHAETVNGLFPQKLSFGTHAREF